MVCAANDTTAVITSRKDLEVLVRKEMMRTVMAYSAGRQISTQVASVIPAINKVLGRIVATQ